MGWPCGDAYADSADADNDGNTDDADAPNAASDADVTVVLPIKNGDGAFTDSEAADADGVSAELLRIVGLDIAC